MRPSQNKVRFTKTQLKTIIGCYVVYTAAYLGRLNFAEALPAISTACGYSPARLGILQTVFAVTYAAGQLVNGSLADRHRPLRFILTGLAGTAACNLCFGLVSSYPLMLAIWMLNGISQSMLWTPTMKLISEWFEGPSRARACFIMSACPIVGHLTSWSLAAYCSTHFGWSAAFFAPGLILFLVLLLAAFVLRDDTSGQSRNPSIKSSDTERLPFSVLLFGTGLFAVLIACVMNGFVRDGITTWSPAILANAFGGSLKSSYYSLIIPFINVFGWIFSQTCFKKIRGGARFCIMIFMCGCAITCGLTYLLKPSSAVILACTLGVSGAILYGNTPMLTAMVPMEYASAKRVALVAGMIDSFIYIGSALSGVLLGHFADSDQNSIYLVLSVCCAVGAVFSGLSIRFARRANLR